MQQNRFFAKNFAYNNQNVLNKLRFVVLNNSFLWVQSAVHLLLLLLFHRRPNTFPSARDLLIAIPF